MIAIIIPLSGGEVIMPKVQINGVNLHYHVKGRGTPIIFIHPPLLTKTNFAYQEAQLSGDYQVITFDVRGHGHSEPSKQPVTYSLIVEDMKQLLDHLRLKEAYVCGYSTGGSVALEAMLTYPERFVGAIIVSGMSEASTFALRSEIRLARWFSSTRPLMSILSRAIAWGNADMVFTYKNMLKDAKKGHLDNIHQYYSCSSSYRCTDKLSRIKQPVLLVYGAKDKRFVKYAKLLEQGLPHAVLRYVPGARHQLPTKEAATLNLLIRSWLRERLAEKQGEELLDEAKVENSPEVLDEAWITQMEQAQAGLTDGGLRQL
jgi:pimeloyl-ACP methyl ester carboxylesterase